MVRSQFLTPEHLIRAMKRGDFYASSGVTLRDFKFDDATRTLSIEIDSSGEESYETEFVATLAEGHADDERVGVRVAKIEGLTPKYTMTGNELYIRAIITSSKPHIDPSFE